MPSHKPNFYAIIPADVRYAEITPNAKLLYGEITALCSKEGFCWAGNKYFAELYKVSKRSVDRWLAELESIEAIKITGKTNKRSIQLATKMSLTTDKNVAKTRDKIVLESNTDRVLHNNIASASPSAPFSTKGYILKCLDSPREIVQIIGMYADELYSAKRLNEWQTLEQGREFVGRNLKIAKTLVPYSAMQIRVTIQRMLKKRINGQPMEFTLETVAKHIDDKDYGGN